MTLDTFFEKFELLADAPNAVARMRELILEWAYQGMLLPAKSAQKCNKIPLGPLIANRLATIVPADYPTQMFELWSVPSFSTGEPEIVRGIEIGSAKRELPDGSILLSKINPHLNRVWQVKRRTKNRMISSTEWITITPDKNWSSDFLTRVLSSKSFNLELCSSAKGMGSLTRSNTKRVAEIEVPCPPVAEQKRIVAKVDELMALCDRLEAQQQDRYTRQAILARAALSRFAGAPTVGNLGYLFHPAFTIAPGDLRKAILTLAVQGKLVEQDPNDEPAVALVERASALREQFSSGKRAKSAKRMREMDDKKRRHDVPDSWMWCRLGDLVLDFRYGTSRKCDRNDSGVPVLRIPNIQNGRIDSHDLKFTNMPPAEFAELCLQDGDLLLVRSNGSENLVGRSAVASVHDERFAYAGYLVRARLPKQEVFAPFLHVALSTPSVRDQIEGPIRTTSGVKNINTTELSNLVVPLPPHKEQHRIVAKVDQLMALVDQLETQLRQSKVAAANLLSALVAELTSRKGGSDET